MKQHLRSLSLGTAALPVIVILLYSFGASRVAGQVVVWGDNYYGQTNVPAAARDVVALAAGDDHCLALRRDGDVIAWGANYWGQTNVPPDATNIVAIAAGSAHSLALRRDGTIAMWGKMFTGVTNVSPSATNVVALGLGPGAQHAVALRKDGTVVDWGNTSYGLTNIPQAAEHIVAVAAGAFLSLALRSDGRVVAWGDNVDQGTNVPPAATNIVAIATGWYGNAALRADGTVLAWGSFSTLTPSPGFTNVVDLACPFSSSYPSILGLRRNGTLAQWTSTPAPVYATNQICAVGGGSKDGLLAVGEGMPVFPGMPIDRTVVGGATAYLRMAAVGALPLGYQWSCDGTNLPGATNTVLVLTNAQTSQAETSYTLTATNALGAATSGASMLHVLPFELAIQPHGLTVAAGSNRAFTASATGQGPFSYQWQLNGSNLSGATNSSLSLTNIQLNQAGTYSLVISNIFGELTNNDALLNVGPLLISVQPQSQLVVAGTNVTLFANTVGQGPFGYQWTFNGTNLDGGTDNPLVLTNVQVNQAGVYSVIGSNAFGLAASENVALTVIPLQITGQPPNETVVAGTNAVLSVAVNGQTPLYYQWQFHGANVTGATDQLLTLTNVQLSQAGEYSVVVSNIFETVASSNAILTVIPLSIASQPKSQGGFFGLSIMFDVQPIFQGPFAYQWCFNGTNIQGATANTLVLTNLQFIQAGSYSVFVSNVYGSVTSSLATLGVSPIAAWGNNAYGQTNIPSGLTNALAVAASLWSSMVLGADGTVVAWGHDNYGQVDVPPNLTNAISIAAGLTHGLALEAEGTLRAWGDYFDGAHYYPAVPPANLTNVVAISAGYYHAMALKANGTVTAWGYNQVYGQTNVPTDLTNVVGIAAGGFYSMALKADGTVVAWGGQDRGETNLPPDLSNVIAIAAGSNHGLALKADGTVVGWGDNSNGGINLPGDLANVVAISAGDSCGVALRTDGSVVTWGNWLNGGDVPANFTSAAQIAVGTYVMAIPGSPTVAGLSVDPILCSNGFSLLTPTQSGRVYRLEYKNSIPDPTWTALPLVAGNGRILSLADLAATNSQRFYRVQRW